jgi:hypothetical protein
VRFWKRIISTLLGKMCLEFATSKAESLLGNIVLEQRVCGYVNSFDFNRIFSFILGFFPKLLAISHC